jgi:hypothetical protein
MNNIKNNIPREEKTKLKINDIKKIQDQKISFLKDIKYRRIRNQKIQKIKNIKSNEKIDNTTSMDSIDSFDNIKINILNKNYLKSYKLENSRYKSVFNTHENIMVNNSKPKERRTSIINEDDYNTKYFNEKMTINPTMQAYKSPNFFFKNRKNFRNFFLENKIKSQQNINRQLSLSKINNIYKYNNDSKMVIYNYQTNNTMNPRKKNVFFLDKINKKKTIKSEMPFGDNKVQLNSSDFKLNHSKFLSDPNFSNNFNNPKNNFERIEVKRNHTKRQIYSHQFKFNNLNL